MTAMAYYARSSLAKATWRERQRWWGAAFLPPSRQQQQQQHQSITHFLVSPRHGLLSGFQPIPISVPVLSLGFGSRSWMIRCFSDGPVWEEEAEIINESGEVVGSYKGVRAVKPGFDDHVYIGSRKRLFKDPEIVLQMLRAIKRWGGGWGDETVRELELLNVIPTEYHVTEVLLQLGNVEVMLGFLNWARKQTWYRPSSVTYAVVIQRLGLHKDFGRINQTLELMRAEACPPTAITYSFLIKCYCSALRLDDAFASFAEMRKFGCRPDTLTCNLLIELLVKANTRDKAIAVFDEMEKNGVEPDKHTLELIVPCLARFGAVDRAWTLYEGMRERGQQPTLPFYASLIESLGRAGRLNSTFLLYKEVHRNGMKLIQSVYMSVIDAFAKSGKLEIAMSVWKDMTLAGYRPTGTLFASIIDVHLKARQLEKAMQLLSEMLTLGFLPSRGLYSDLIDANIKARHLQTARELYSGMHKAQVLPIPPVCSALVDAHLMEGDLTTALDLLNSSQNLGFVHNEKTYSHLFTQLVKTRQFSRIAEVVKDMLKLGYLVDGLSSNSVMGLLQEGHSKPAGEFYEILVGVGVKPSARASRLLMESCLKEGDYDRAELALKKFMEQGYSSDLRMYTTLLGSFARCTNVEKERVLMSMMSATDHKAHKFLCGLLTGPKERKVPALEFVRTFYGDLSNENEEKTAQWFTCVLLNYLVLTSQIKRARCVWKVAYEKKLFPRRILFEQDLAWSLDVRALSIGASLTAVAHTLSRFKKRMMHYNCVPRRVKIVTGFFLREPIEELLKSLDSPFESTRGSLRCRGQFVADWFRHPFVEKFLESEIPSKEEILMQRINLVFEKPPSEHYMLIMNAKMANAE